MLLQELNDLLRQRKKEALKEGRGLFEFVFYRNDKPIAQNSVRYKFKKVLTTGNLRSIRFHDIRHTFASLLLSQGESPVYVKEQLGHYSIQMTVDVYGHLIPGNNRGAVNRLDSPATIRNLSATN